MSKLTNLVKLDLYHCGIQKFQASLVPLEFLEGEKLKLEKLEHLNLSFNKLGSLARAIFHPDFGLMNSSLKELYL
jgi:Leucine-rich repeat (LRR) protein